MDLENSPVAGFSFPALGRIHLDPGAGDMGGGSGGTPPPAIETSPADMVGDATGTEPGTTQPAAPQTDQTPAPAAETPATQPAWQSIREAAASFGLDLNSFADDRQALAHLIRSAQANRQADYYAQLGRQIAPRAQQIQQFLAQQAQPEPAAPSSWLPPEIDERYLALVERDPVSGVFVPKSPGVPASIVDAVNARADWERRFNADPAGFLEPFVEQRARQIADERIDARFAEQQRSMATSQILQSNAQWLYQPSPQGGYARTHDGRPLLTPAGTRYAQHVRALEADGVTDPMALDRYARTLLHGEILAAQNGQQNPANPAASAQASLAGVRPNVNPLQSRGGAPRHVPGATEPSTEGLSLREQLTRAFADIGVTEADFKLE